MRSLRPPAPRAPHLFANLGWGAKQKLRASRARQNPSHTQNPVAATAGRQLEKRLVKLLSHLKVRLIEDGGSGLFSQTSSSALHLIFFNSDLDLLYCHSAAASENSKSRLPLRDIQVKMIFFWGGGESSKNNL